MYLKSIYVENVGPIEQFFHELPFDANGSPKPIILVGKNGSGKTGLLSTIADGIFELAAENYSNVLPTTTGGARSWFRVAGGSTIRVGARGSFSALEFKQSDKVFSFHEKAGVVEPTELKNRLPASLQPLVKWEAGDSSAIKETAISEEDSRSIFNNGVYAYFPSSRSEMPHWLNESAGVSDLLSFTPNRTRRLNKPIYVEKGIDTFRQWIGAVILDSRADFITTFQNENSKFEIAGDITRSIQSKTALLIANNILKLILDQPEAYFGWLGRHHPEKIGIGLGGGKMIPTLKALSSGEATLLAIFGTILQYADNPAWRGALLKDLIEGICIIDEIDAHMHIDLQDTALPKLIKLFPKVQFIVSTHSPLLVLGMQHHFGEEGLQILEMPKGVTIPAEGYSEFARALTALKKTNAFNEAVTEAVRSNKKFLVFVEGITDPKYFRTAAELLRKEMILNNVDFEWIGALDQSGQAFHTGKDALNHTYKMLCANPQFITRPVLFLYDVDVGKLPIDAHQLFVRSLNRNPNNERIKSGVENLLPPHVLTDNIFDTELKSKDSGEIVKIERPNKVRLCDYLCDERRDKNDFLEFDRILTEIEGLVKPTLV